ncbi:hypothetical protein RND59_19430 [Vibrio ruber]|uniref:FG-GAP repeat protein n=1 Tax=Vibrio ruber (strain DSM 16370 / JCM 11486 / BCRC 17186 / CECT 7878 / LMG 23124 / VR1) TaxID=1123498 RepID=A0A1R4LB79_VIBR1|nr:hypothetical protein [Vibrio ruber]WNJ97373.1 hypothetical protein RND59_19430 [Vibrio ruber]SJN53653.1 hypothetical protein VR7878_00427 [Vibrio ruber DSM 16370]
MIKQILIAVAAAVVSLPSVAYSERSSEVFTVVDGNQHGQRIESFELGDVDGDGVQEIIYLTSVKHLEVVSYTKPIDASFFTQNHNTVWTLKDHKYSDKLFFIVFDGNQGGAYFKLDGSFSELIPLEIKDGHLYGKSGNDELYIDKVTDDMIHGQIKDSRIDRSYRAVPSEFIATRIPR